MSNPFERSASDEKLLHDESIIEDLSQKLSGGAGLIAEERQRQINIEKWTPEHDDEHVMGQLAIAAACYAEVSSLTVRARRAGRYLSIPNEILSRWPWSTKWWKPSSDPIRNLVKAGALIAAEIDRLQRLPAASSK